MRTSLPALLMVLLLTGCPSARRPLPVYWKLPDFQLTSQSAQAFDSKSLNGNIWVADFIFTTCAPARAVRV